MALGSHLITVRRLEKYINDVIGKKANLPDTSKTIIGNISQINSDLTWKLLANKTGNTAIDLPLTFKEIHIRVWMPTANLYVENNFLYEDFNRLTFRYLHSIGGWYYTSNNNGWCTLADQNGQIYLNSAFYSGTNITSECQIKVWYR